MPNYFKSINKLDYLENLDLKPNILYWIFSQLGELNLKSIYKSLHVEMNFKKF